MRVNYEKLFKVLEERKLTLTKLSHDLKISSTTLSKLGKGDYISLQTLEKISVYLNLQPGDIFSFPQKKRESAIVTRLRSEKKHKIKGGLYHETQVLLTFNSNNIEGSTISLDLTRNIFETNQVLIGQEKTLNIDDVTETINHFRAIDYMLDIIYEPLNEQIIKDLHLLLKRNTKDEKLDWFRVGSYKEVPNVVSGYETTPPEDVACEMSELINRYENGAKKTFKAIIDFHYHFEKIHPFQDGNGRVGRLIAFKELLRHNHVPFTIDQALKNLYYRGFIMYPENKAYLFETCLAGQDKYKKLCDYFKVTC
ncbi:MAG TPA: Fic family protein [Bacilli bacterium]|nr:Fic family protein [Bacilli bacterium]